MSVPEYSWSPLAKRALQGDPIGAIFGKVQRAQAENPGFISLAAGPPPHDLLPSQEFAAIIQRAQQQVGPPVLNYGRPAGLPPLCQAWAAELKAQYEVVCEDPMTNMLITSGGMEAMSLSILALVKEGDNVLVESPAFPGTLSAITLAGGTPVHVECDEQGMVPSALEAAIAKHDAKIVALMPDFQNPSGRAMSRERREAIAAILIKTGTIALEDGVYAPLRFRGGPLPALQSFAPDNVIYASSVSKSIAPAERVGVLVAPAEFVQVIANIKSVVNMQASTVLQGVAAAFLAPDGPLSAHLASMLPKYAKRSELMIQAIAKHLPGYTVTQPEGGMFLWITGPEDVNFTELSDAAIANGVAYVPGSLFYADGQQGHNQVRFNFASTPEDKIDEAIRRVAQTVSQATS